LTNPVRQGRTPGSSLET